MGYNYGYYDTGYSQPQFGFSYESYDRGGYPRGGYYMDRPHIPRPLRRAFWSLETPLLDDDYGRRGYMPYGRDSHYMSSSRGFYEDFGPRGGHGGHHGFGGSEWNFFTDGNTLDIGFSGLWRHSGLNVGLSIPLNREPQEEQAPPPPPRHEVTLMLTPKAPPAAPPVTPPPAEPPKSKPASPVTSAVPAPPKPQKSPEEIRSGLDKSYERVKSLLAKVDQCGITYDDLEAKDQAFLRRYITTTQRKMLLQSLIKYTKLSMNNSNLSDAEKTALTKKLTGYTQDLDALKKHTEKK